MDDDIKLICESVRSGHLRCAEITAASSYRQMTDAEAAEVYPIVSAGLRDIATLALMPSSSLLGCQQKASVLALIQNDDLSASLVADVLMVVKEVISSPLILDDLSEVQA